MTNEKYMLKSLIMVASEQSITKIEENAYEKVSKYLKNNYDCDLSDCLEKPEYLKKTLDELYGESYEVIFDSIKQKLSNFVHHEDIQKFLLGLKHY